MNDELDALWPARMVQKRNELRAERIATKARKDAEAEAARDLQTDCSVVELQRQKMQDAKRRGERNDGDAFYRPARFKQQQREQSRP